MGSDDLAFLALAANPAGGLLVAVPFAILRLHYPAWLAVAASFPLAYLQVPAVDLGWSLLVRVPAWGRFLARRRSARIERLVAARGAFWVTFFATPFLGPWLVMAFMRYAQVPQRRVAAPILCALAVTASAVAGVCELIPRAFAAESATPSAPSVSSEVLPLVSYSSDVGVGLGARGMVQRSAPGVEPYEASLEAQGFATTIGDQFHFLFVDLPHLGGSSFRLDVLGGYRRDSSAAYYGVGDHPTPAAGLPDSYDSYTEEAPVVRVRLRRPIIGALSAIGGYRFLWQRIDRDASSLLAQQAPLGVDGGPYGEVAAGLAWDTRDDEMEPARGVLVEATARGTAPASGSRYVAGGAFLSASAYGALLPTLVLAGRVAADETWGDVPFDRLQDFGSLVAPFFQVSGVGGALTVRGLRQSEYIGHGKAIANAEVRWRFATVHVWGRDVRFSSVAFADAGAVWSPGAPTLHPGTGGGLRIAWGKLVVLRADAAYAEGGVRVYADFRHVF